MLSKLFRKKSLDELKAEADALFDRGAFGDAKLSYDRLEERAAKENAALQHLARERVSECCDRIAEKRVEEAKQLARNGNLDLAREELKHALETARGEAALNLVRDTERALEQKDAIEHATVAELSDEERLTLIQSSWEPLQAEELESYGEPLQRAVIALDKGRDEDAREILEKLIQTAKEPSYLWLELGRARLGVDDLEGGEKALRTFLSRIGPEEGGGARLAAHRELTRLLHARGDRDAALAELEAACEALDEDPRPLLDLGSYLRLLERPKEAVEVLELCAGLFNEERIEWPVLNELGQAYADAHNDDKAVEILETMLEHFAQKQQLDFPTGGAVALARIHERRGKIARAADIYRALADGSDVANHEVYHLEAARLLGLLGLTDEARRMAERAAALKKVPLESPTA